MKKTIFILSITTLFSVAAVASNSLLGEPRELLPNEDIKSFSMVDLNGDNVDELVFVTESGQLKYAPLTGLGQGLVDSSAYQRFRNNRDSYLMNISVKGDGATNTKLGVLSNGSIGIAINGGYRCEARMSLQNNKVVARDNSFYDSFYELTYISDDYVVGKMKCSGPNGMEQNEVVSFTATRQ
ncbi:hypothetical protein [Vibrio sp. J383]|uniref:hypothetical protein n=1 Tax=Vibrio sp. J383 TaxID=2942997 RepID=UPI0020BD891E|nr:hypothetical protein [Vibrio sp. J383]UQV23164.1 hypothetical protein M4S28_21715 [Vibrio sp. J383]